MDHDFKAALVAKEHFQTALGCMKKAQYATALLELEQCLKAPYIPTTVYFQLGCCHLQLNHFTPAKNYFEKVLKENPFHQEALVNFGACFMQESDYKKAIEIFATATRLDEKNPLARFNLACALMRARRYIQARDQFELYLKQVSEDLEAQYHLGFVHLLLDELTQAEKHLQKILAVDPTHVLALHGMASVALKKEEPSVAIGFYQRLLAQDPTDEVAIYMMAALTQQTESPQKAPNAYVENLFDAYAERFDAHLLETLHYQTPEKLYALWRRHERLTQALQILDLGCGTGLMGKLLKPHAKKLIGVDLSCQMLQVAEEKNIYDQLQHAEMLEFLHQSNEIFDLVVLADVVVYVGDLEALLQALAKVTKALLFSIELSPIKGSDFYLSRHGRYQHGLSYVQNLLKAHGFLKHYEEKNVLRLQNQQDVEGVLLYAKMNS